MRTLGITLVLAVATALALVASPQDQDLDVELQRAVQKAVTTGDLTAAVESYRDIVARAGSNREVAARALLRMAESYQRLGDAQAREVYEQIVREYPDQGEAVRLATARLAVIDRPAPSPPTLSVRRVWEAGTGFVFGSTSRDGRYLSLSVVDRGLFVRDLATGEMRDLPHPDTAAHPGAFALGSTISPDGRQVAYAWGPTPLFELRLASVTGERRVLYRSPGVFYLEPGGWSPDGTQVLAFLAGRNDRGRNNRIALISVAEGTARIIANLGWRTPGGLRFSPDGRYIVYDAPVERDSPLRDVFIMAADNGREVPLVEHPGDDYVLGWAPDGTRVLFASDRTGSTSAFAITVAGGRPRGEPRLVKSDIGPIAPLGITSSGAVYYSLDTGGTDVQIAMLDPASGDVVAPASPASARTIGRSSAAAWSPDGRYLAYYWRGAAEPFKNGPRSIHVLEVANGEERVLSPRLALFYTEIRPRWSPDGRSLLVSAAEQGESPGLFQIDMETGEVTTLTREVSRYPFGEWSADGRSLYYVHGPSADGRVDIRLRNLESGQERVLYQPLTRPGPAFPIRHLALSPDGSQLAFFAALGTGRGGWRLLVMPAAGGETREVMTPDAVSGGLEWTRDGRHLLFSGDGLWQVPSSGGARQKLDVTPPARAGLSLHRDGRRLAFTTVAQQLEIWVMENALSDRPGSQ